MSTLWQQAGGFAPETQKAPKGLLVASPARRRTCQGPALGGGHAPLTLSSRSIPALELAALGLRLVGELVRQVEDAAGDPLRPRRLRIVADAAGAVEAVAVSAAASEGLRGAEDALLIVLRVFSLDTEAGDDSRADAKPMGRAPALGVERVAALQPAATSGFGMIGHVCLLRSGTLTAAILSYPEAGVK